MNAAGAAPPDLRGRQRPDRMFTLLGKLITGLEWIASSAYLRRPEARSVVATSSW
jgi:hypothetical protein